MFNTLVNYRYIIAVKEFDENEADTRAEDPKYYKWSEPYVFAGTEKIGEFFCHTFYEEEGDDIVEYWYLISEEKNTKKPGIGSLYVKRTGDHDWYVSLVVVKKKFQKQGIGKALYKVALNHHGKLLSDKQVSKKAEYVWKSLSKEFQVELNKENGRHSATKTFGTK